MAARALSPITSNDWNTRTARHLLNRAGFGQPRELIDRMAALGPEGAVDHLVNYDAIPDNLVEPDFLVPPLGREELRRRAAGLSEEERRKLQNEYQQEEREAIARLKAWWLERMYRSPRPLQEKLALFWHGHFATSAQKVRSSTHTYQLNKVFRENAAGNFKTLTIHVGQSPSMLRYLDNVQSTKQHPNENWARELMELFTLGQGQYTEDDIKESARAFTGWSANHERFIYREDVHDFGEKVFMGRRGKWDGWDIIDIIFEQPAAAAFIANKLWTYFAYDDPDPDIVEGLAQTLRASRYELRPMLRQMFLARAFYSDRAIGTQVKSPVQFVVQLAADLDYDHPPYAAMARATQALGQDLFYPPNVKGWDGNLAWANANTMLIRFNLPGQLLTVKPKPEDSYMGQAAPDRPAPGADFAREMMAPPVASPSGPAAGQPRWDPRAFFGAMEFKTAGECVTKLSEHFLNVPLSTEQQRVLIEALGVPGGADVPARGKQLNPRNLMAALHLLLSTAEYQLC